MISPLLEKNIHYTIPCEDFLTTRNNEVKDKVLYSSRFEVKCKKKEFGNAK